MLEESLNSFHSLSYEEAIKKCTKKKYYSMYQVINKRAIFWDLVICVPGQIL